jgi:hypothetical protein
MTDTWATDGANGPPCIPWIDEENHQEPDCIGLVPHDRRDCPGGVRVTENNFDENALEHVDFQMLIILSLCYIYTLGFLP